MSTSSAFRHGCRRRRRCSPRGRRSEQQPRCCDAQQRLDVHRLFVDPPACEADQARLVGSMGKVASAGDNAAVSPSSRCCEQRSRSQVSAEFSAITPPGPSPNPSRSVTSWASSSCCRAARGNCSCSPWACRSWGRGRAPLGRCGCCAHRGHTQCTPCGHCRRARMGSVEPSAGIAAGLVTPPVGRGPAGRVEACPSMSPRSTGS